MLLVELNYEPVVENKLVFKTVNQNDLRTRQSKNEHSTSSVILSHAAGFAETREKAKLLVLREGKGLKKKFLSFSLHAQFLLLL